MAQIVADLASQFDVQRPAVRKALRSGGALPPWNPKRTDGPGRPVGGGEPPDPAALERARVEKLQREQERLDRMRPAPVEPCGRCGVRADVGCKHRPAEGPPPLAIERSEIPLDGRRQQRFWGPGNALRMRNLTEQTRVVRARMGQGR